MSNPMSMMASIGATKTNAVNFVILAIDSQKAVRYAFFIPLWSMNLTHDKVARAENSISGISLLVMDERCENIGINPTQAEKARLAGRFPETAIRMK